MTSKKFQPKEWQLNPNSLTTKTVQFWNDAGVMVTAQMSLDAARKMVENRSAFVISEQAIGYLGEYELPAGKAALGMSDEPQAAVAITDTDAVATTPSEVKANDGQPSAANEYIPQEGHTVEFSLAFDDYPHWGTVTESFADTKEVIIEYNNSQLHVKRRWSDVTLSQATQPASGWVADALATIDVTTEARAANDYLPPTVDEEYDDLPFSDLGEDETSEYDSLLATLVKFAVNGKVASQRELALSLISGTQWHAMEVEREVEEMESVSNLTVGPKGEIFWGVYEVIKDIHAANKNGALA